LASPAPGAGFVDVGIARVPSRQTWRLPDVASVTKGRKVSGRAGTSKSNVVRGAAPAGAGGGTGHLGGLEGDPWIGTEKEADPDRETLLI
jgi:hypothetical protein